MKSKCSFILKASTALVLALLMLFGTVTTSLAAVVDNAATGADADVAGTGYSGWVIKGNLDGWTNNLASGSGSSGDAYIDCSSLIGSNFEFKLICEGTYCGTSLTTAISKGTEYSLTWNGGNNIKYKVTGGSLKIHINDTKITISEDNGMSVYLYGDGISGGNWTTKTNSSFKMSQTSGTDVFTKTVTMKGGAKRYFRGYKDYGSGTEYGKTGSDAALTNGSSSFVSADNSTAKAFYVDLTNYGSTSDDISVTITLDLSSGFKASWSAKTYTVTYNKGSNGTGTNTTDTKTYNTALTLKGAIFTRTGYTQTAWNTDSSGTGGTSYALGGSYTANAAVTLYPTWTQNTYAITLSETGATGGALKVDGAAFTSGTTVTHGSHTFRVDAPTGYVIDSISGIGTWTNNGSYATLGSTSITEAKTISVSYAADGRPSLAAISDVSKDANTTTFNVTATINDEDKKTGTLSATASSATTSVATVGTPTVSGSTVTIPVTIKGVVGSSDITVTLKDGSTTVSTQTFSVSMEEPTFTIANKSVYVYNKNTTAATVTNGGVAPSSIAYTSGNTSYVTVNATTGTLTAASVQTNNKAVTMTAEATYASGYKKTTTYTVTLQAPTLTASSSAATGNIGDTATGSVSGSKPVPTNSSYVTGYSWSSSDSNVVEVSDSTSATPTFTFKKNGSATITLTVTYKNTGLTKTATTSITVSAPTVTMSNAAQTVAVGDTYTRTATGSTLGSQATGAISYSSSATSKATVNATTGVVTGVAVGSSTITATYTVTCGGQTTTKTASYTVNVAAPSLNVKQGSTSVVNESVYTTTGSDITLDVEKNFSDTLTAKSSKTSVATVSLSGNTLTIHPVAKGTCKVSVSTDSGFAPTGASADLAATAAAMPAGIFKKVFEYAATGAVDDQTAQFTVNVAEAESGHVVYLTDNAGWGSAVIHSWGTDGTGAITDHAAMTKVGVNNSNQDVYAYRFTDAQWSQVKHIRFLKSSSTTWDGNADQTVTITSFTSNAWYTTNSSSPRDVGTWNCTLQKPQVSLADASIDMGGTKTMTATVLTSGTPSTFNWSSGTTSVATTADTHTESNVISGVAPGTSTITVKAYADKTTDFKSLVTDGSADDFVAGTATATATVVAENKTVTFGAKKTDNGSSFTDLSGAVTAKYYDEDTSGSSSSGSGSSGSGSSGSSSGSGAGKYMWYNTNNSKDLNAATSAGEMIDLGDGTCYGSFTCAAGQNYDVVINNSSTKGSCLNSSTTVTGNQTWAKVEDNGGTYWALDSYSATVPIYVIYDPTANSVRFTTTNPASGSSSGGSSGSGSSGSSGTGTTGEGTAMTSPASVPYGKVAVFTAEATKTVSGVTYYFAEWVDENDDTISTDNPYTVKVTANKSVYARYYQVYKLSAFDSYTSDGTNVTFVTAPPKLITVKHGDDTYIYSYSGTAATGNPNSPDGDKVAALAIGGGTYGQGNYIQYYAGDEITLYYTSMASSEIFKGVFYNNSANYYVAKPSAAQYVAHDYSAGKTLYMNSAYYDSVPSGLPSTTVDHDAHSIKFTGTQDYKNIDVEIGTKRKVYFSDYTNAVIGSKNVDDYYSDGEALSVTGDQLTVKAAGSATQTNSINKDNVKFYKADANGQPTGSALSGFTVAYDSGSDPVTNSGSTASTRYIIISGNMPAFDLYIDLNMTNSYTIKLGSKVISDSLANKTRLAEVANITIKEGSTTKLTALNNADVTSTSYSAPTATALTLTTAYTGSWDDYYTFVGWYWGDDTAPDYAKGFISDKLTLNYTPKKGGTIWAVGTRSLYINGSKYITGKDTDWYGENNTQKNLEMSFDAESGRYYWEITDTMFASAGSNYKTWKEENSSATTEYGRYHTGDDTHLYWYNTDDKYHGKAFFQILDQESGNSNKSIWKQITSFAEDTPANGPTYGKVYPPEGSYDDKQSNGQGFINFNETDYAGQSSPLRIYFNPSATGNDRLTVESTKIYSNIYVSNGFTVGSTLRTSDVTVEPVVDGTVKTSGQTGYFSVGKQGTGWDPDVEGHVNHYKPQKKGATVRITKTAGGSDKIVAFFIYDITNKTVRAERDVKKSGSKYYIDLTLANEEQNLYIVPIVEEAGANVTISFDATQLNRAQWGDIVTAYAWYSGSGGNALGGYPGQPMIPSDDMTTWTTTFKGTNSNNDELQGITFSNYVDGNHSWLGCSGIMGTVSDHKTGTASGGIVNVYNHVYSGNSGEYARTNFKAQTYDYREPIALYDRFKSEDHVSISFSMKDGNSSLLSWHHSELLSNNILDLPSGWTALNWEYLTNAKGDKYIDMNGNTMKSKPTASFYVAAKGQVMYGSSNMNYVFYGGKGYDSVTGVNYGAASGIGMNYAVQWYVYDASGNYITNVLTAGIADLASGSSDSYIGKRLEDMGYAVDGKSVAICYDKPRYMYGDAESGTGAIGYDSKLINVGNDFDAYRFTGQWNAVANNDNVTVNVGVGMMTDSGEVLAGSNTAAYGNAKAYYMGSASRTTDADGVEAPFTASDNSFVRTSVRDASNSPVKLNASAQNFIGWYYYDANTGDFVKANYASNENFYPNYSNKDVTFYAMYRASAVYQYKYTGREGARTYSASGNDLTAAEMADNNKINPASHEADIIKKVPVGIGVFKKDINFSTTNYNSWTKTPDSNGYILDITGFTVTNPTYSLTAHYKDENGQLVTVSDSAEYNGKAVNLTSGSYTDSKNNSKPSGIAVTSYHPGFIGWFEYNPNNETIGDLLSTQANFGMRLTKNQHIIARYEDDGSTLPADGWKAFIDENEVNKELDTVDSGDFYNDTIVRVRNSSDVKATLPTNAKIGVIVVCDNKTNETINSYSEEQLNSLVGSISPGNTMGTKKGLSITNMQASAQTSFNRTDIAVKTDYAKALGSKYCVYAYIYDGQTYHFSAPSEVKTYE